MSPILKSTDPHLNQTLDNAKLFIDHGLKVSGKNFLDFHLLIKLLTHLPFGFVSKLHIFEPPPYQDSQKVLNTDKKGEGLPA